ncbi:MAG: phosphotransferase enzyme family protein [Rhizobiaceae bacterium]
MTDLKKMHQTAIASLKHWDLPDQQPELIQHRENTVFRVEDGAGNRFALRIHRRDYHSHSALKSELDLMAMLARGRLSVPAPIATAEGALCGHIPTEGNGTRIVDLLSWLDGRSLGKTGEPLGISGDKRREIFEAIGREMARLHNLADEWTLPQDFCRPAWDCDGLVGDNPFWGRFWELEELSVSETKLLNSARDHLRNSLQDLADSRLDHGIIHADLVRENILIADDGVKFIDFDDCGFGFRLFDIATALLKNSAEPDYANLQDGLISGYRRERTLSDAGLACLPLFLMARSFTYLGWVRDRRHEPGVAARIPRLIADAVGRAELLVN